MLSMEWQKASFSNGNGGSNCVEARIAPSTLADKPGTIIEVRDSKHPSDASLKFTPAEWKAFLSGASAGEFNIPS